MKRGIVLTLLVGLVLLLTAQVAFAGPLPGAIFTTLEDGSRVNANIYQAKEDVYLDGGPGMNAPVGAAGLPEGDYYFQVTDPSGKVLLSEDPVACRKVHVNSYGVIDYIYPAMCEGKRGEIVDCTHEQGVDQDHGDAPWNAITVQLMPYKNTPNNGGVYKVWMTPVEKYEAGKGFHGFIPSWSKTDNYKVKGKIIPPKISVKKFHDLNANGVWDDGEPELNWQVDYTDPLGAGNTGVTPFCVDPAMPAGTWSFTEIFPEGYPAWKQTAVYVDGVAMELSPTALVEVLGTSGETHEVVFGNVQLACVKGKKFYDGNANGVRDPGELPIEGFKFHLTGTAVDGSIVDEYQFTNEWGTVKWCDLLPGDYQLEEVMPSGDCWRASTDVRHEFSLAGGDYAKFMFGNYCVCTVDFNTKGFWHNKNGLDILAENPEWIACVNAMAPYASNPFDGMDAEGNPVPAAQGPAGEMIAAEGTALAEISAYLVAPNAGGDPKIQLGQQLLAFIFNVKFTGAGCLEGPDGWMSASDMIDAAIAAWECGGDDAIYWAGVLDCFNNNDAVEVLCAVPCRIEYL